MKNIKLMVPKLALYVAGENYIALFYMAIKSCAN
jgi:hypothetical protein